MKKSFIILALVAGALGGSLYQSALAALKVWGTSESVLNTDLNSNFSQLSTECVGTGHASLTNSMVSSSAAIAHSKLATPALLPKAWAYVAATCSSSPCTLGDSSGVTSVTRTSEGLYVLTTSSTLTASKAVSVTPIVDSAPGDATNYECWVRSQTTTTVTFTCQRDNSDVPEVEDVGFSIIVFDT